MLYHERGEVQGNYNFLYTTRRMVRKLARPPMTLEIGSAMKTPLTPNPSRGGFLRQFSSTVLMS